MLNSGAGEFGAVELATGHFEPIAFCPGYLRGLAFIGDYAVVTLSKRRHVTFHDLALDDQFQKRGAEPQCGLHVIDLRTGTISHWLRLDGSLVTELDDVMVLAGVRQPPERSPPRILARSAKPAAKRRHGSLPQRG